MNDHEAIAHLKKTGQYKIIERLHAPKSYHAKTPDTPRLGIVLDTETTGLHTSSDVIIELGFIAFEYDASTGFIHQLKHHYNGFEDPGKPLEPIIKQITGITDAMLKNQKLNEKEIQEWLNKADLIIAHNAAFDRPMLERRLPEVANHNWACSISDIDWMAEHIGSRKLDYLAYQFGFFFDGHRALNDVEATLHILSQTLPVSGKKALAELLQHAREKSRRFFAVGAAFDKKDDLKTKGYRWIPDYAYTDNHGVSKKGVWSIVVAEAAIEAEQIWLQEKIYAGKKTLFTWLDITANNRYSTREWSDESTPSPC